MIGGLTLSDCVQVLIIHPYLDSYWPLPSAVVTPSYPTQSKSKLKAFPWLLHLYLENYEYQ